MNHLGLVPPVVGLGTRVVTGVTLSAHRGRDSCLRQALWNGDVLVGPPSEWWAKAPSCSGR